jgi:uracil-DNA glycosylase
MAFNEKRKEQMMKLKKEIINFDNSLLSVQRKKDKTFPVIGEGDHFAKIMFIGEAPGKKESLTEKPFCGKAGSILNELLESINIERKDVYITNIVKDRPPLNRDPSPGEINLYSPFLNYEIDIIKPKIIATLGRFSSEYILNKFNVKNEGSITAIHGKEYFTILNYGKVKVVPLFHPASAIYDPKKKNLMIKDFKKLKNDC